MKIDKINIGIKFGSWIVIDSEVKRDRFGKKIIYVEHSCGHKMWKPLPEVLLLQKNDIEYCGQCKGKVLFKGEGELSATYFGYLQFGCKRRNGRVEFNVTIQYLWKLFQNQQGKCALSGIELSLKRRKNLKQTASLDRIDSTKGYIEGNVQWVHKDINQMKMKFSQIYFIEMCILVANNIQNSSIYRG